MAWEGRDEGYVTLVRSEIGLLIAKEDLAKGGSYLVACSKLCYRDVAREVRRVTKHEAKTVASFEDGTI